MPIKVAISGAAGAGKSSIIQHIVEKYGYKTSDIGQIWRARAIAKGLTIDEYDKLVEQNPQEDIAMDEDFKKIVEGSNEDIIVSWRMGFHCSPEVFSIRLDISPETGAQRIFLQDRGKQERKYKSIEDAMQANQDRMKRLQERLFKIYKVDFMDKKNYDLIISTEGKTLEENVQEVIKAIEDYKFSHNI